jgi:hypothetical protein
VVLLHRIWVLTMSDNELIDALKNTDSKLCWHAATRLAELLDVQRDFRDCATEVVQLLNDNPSVGGTD